MFEAVLLAVAEAKKRGLEFVGDNWSQDADSLARTPEDKHVRVNGILLMMMAATAECRHSGPALAAGIA